MPIRTILEAVRTASLPGLWSQGVKLAREGRVAEVVTSEAEVTLRVRAPGHVVAKTVTLFLQEEEWSCDCDTKSDPCAHVSAAAIFAARAKDATGDAGPNANATPEVARQAPARLVYRLSKKNRVLVLHRAIVLADGRELAVATTSLSSDIARGRLPEALSPTHDDLHADRLLGSPPQRSFH